VTLPQDNRLVQISDKSLRSIEVFDGWSETYPTISSAKKSIVIVDSFLVNEVGPIETCVKNAVAQPGVGRLAISIYMASPKREFGAQRVREKEGPHTSNEYKQALESPISTADWNAHIDRFNLSLREIRSHIATLPGVDLEIRTYPTMPTTRIFVIDDIDYFFGWFPLLNGNPAYSCCHLRDDGVDKAGKTLAKALHDQVEIIHSISDRAELEPRRVDEGRRISN
jgi:hypothetical protein